MASKGERVSELVIKARDEYSRVLRNIEQQQQDLTTKSAADARRAYQAQKQLQESMAQQLIRTRGEIAKMSNEFRTLANSAEADRGAIARLVIEKTKLRAEALRLQDALGQVSIRTRDVESANRSSFGAFSQNATAMEKEAAAARQLLAVQQQLKAQIRTRLETGVNRTGFTAWSGGAEQRVDVAAEERAAKMVERRAEAQARLDSQVKGGFAAWARYADTIGRIAAQEEKAAAVSARKLAIQQRLDNQVKSGFAAWSRATRGVQQQANAAEQLVPQLHLIESATNRTATAQDRLATALSKVNKVGQRNQGAQQARGNQQEITAFGLRPGQLTNLGYQVNDVVSGLAMGQSPMQVLSQQAGQFIQIWPQAMSGIAASLPLLAGLAAALAPVVAAFTRMKSEANSVKIFSQNLALMADGARYTPERLAQITAEIRRMGVATDEARKSVLAMVNQGFSMQDIGPLAQMANDLRKITGASFEDEIKRLGTAFKGNAESVRELDKELKFLTVDQLRQVYAMEENGDRAGALALAQDALNQRLRAAKAEVGPLVTAFKALGEGWNELVDSFRDTVFTDVIEWLGNDLAKGVNALANDLKMIAGWIKDIEDFFSSNGREGRLQHERDVLEEAIAIAEANGDSDPEMGGSYMGSIQQLKDDLAAVNAELEAIEKNRAAAAKAGAEKEAAEQARATTEETEEQAKLRLDIAAQLEAQLAAMEREAALAEASAREQFIARQELEAQNRAKAAGIKLTEEELRLLRERAGEAYDRSNSPAATGNYGSVVDRIIGVESGGNANAKNPNSSATGLGQFIASTWLAMFKKHFPDRAASMSDAMILELRKNADISRQMVELYARENAKVLQQAGVAVNDAALYLSHFLGPKGAVALLSAKGDTPTSQILGADQISANRSILEGKTAAEVVAWAERKMKISDSELEVNQSLQKIDEDRAKKQKEYLEDYQKRIADGAFELEQARKSAREAAIAKAIYDEESRAKAAGLTLTKEQRAEIEKTTAALFDRQNAETNINGLMAMRTALLESLQIAQAAGDEGAIRTIVGRIGETEDQLKSAIDLAIKFYQEMGGEGAQQAILRLENLRDTLGKTVTEMQTQFLPTAEELNERISESGGNAISRLAESLAAGENAFQSFKTALLSGLGEILIAIGKAIVQQAIFNALTGGGANPGGGAGGFLSRMVGALFPTAHTGGIIGNLSGSTMVDPSVFRDASYYHGGGTISKLGPKEVPIIALEGEEVLTEDSPRHSKNGGGQQPNIKMLNVFNPADVLEMALGTELGERVMINWMTRNANKVGGVLGK